MQWFGRLLSRVSGISFKSLAACGAAALLTCSVFANPVVNNIAAGNVSIQQTPTTTTINQASQKAVINWQSFNINNGEATHFNQPVGGVALNRISPTQGASQIYGSLTATGQIILINPAGVYFGPSAYVNVGGMVASTANITDQNFLNNMYHFSKVDGYSGAIVNDGQIIAAQHGLVALVAPGVVNNGTIQANLGKVVLASGEAFTLNFSGDSLINFAITAKTTSRGIDKDGNPLPAGISNTGSIFANGGTITLSAQAAAGVLDQMINMEGVAQVHSVYEENGKIILSGDPDSGVVRVAANIDASGKGTGEKGGTVEITGHNILLDSGTTIDVSGDTGGGDVFIGGNYQGNGPLPNANATVMAPNATILADAITAGNGGTVILWSDNVTKAYGSISAQGGALSGDGGFIETSGHYLDVNGIQVSTYAPNGHKGMWLLDPTDLTISTGGDADVDHSGDIFTADNNSTSSVLNITTLTNQLASTDVTVLTTSGGSGAGSGDITIANDINWASDYSLTLSAFRNIVIDIGVTISNAVSSNAVLNLIANNTGAFAVGSGDGVVTNNGTINMAGAVNVYYNPSAYTSPVVYTNAGAGAVTAYMLINSAADLQSLSDDSALWASNFALSTDIDASGLASFMPIGNNSTSFTGNFDGLSHVIDGLTINLPLANFVGLFGSINGSEIKNIGLTNIDITGATQVGGLVGRLTNSVITNSYNTGNVSGSGFIGGLVGAILDAGTISDSYNAGNVNGDQSVGGLVGYVDGEGTIITNSYNMGNVSGDELVGGLVGIDNSCGGGCSGMITNSYNTGNVSGDVLIGGLLGGGSSAITNSYNIGNISGNEYVGGLAGDNTGTGAITNSYNMGNVSGDQLVGGLVGYLNDGSITNSYSTGQVTGNANVGGLVGTNVGGTVNNSYWNTETSGLGMSAGGEGLTTAQMMNQANFTGWDFASTWSMANDGFPYLQVFYPGDVRVISGYAPGANETVSLAANGSLIGSISSYANGFYYFLTGENAISGIDTSIANSANILAYLDNSTNVGNAISITPASATGSVTGLDIAANTVSVGSNNTAELSISDLSSAKGALSDDDILYSISGDDLTLGNAVYSDIGLATTANTTYTITGDLSTFTGGNGNYTFNGITRLNVASVTIDAGGGDITFNNLLDSSTVTARALTLNSTGTTTLGVTGSINALSTLTTNAGGTTSLDGNVTTVGNQTYNDVLTFTGDRTLTATGANSIITIAQPLSWAGAETLSLTASGASGQLVLPASITATNGTLNLDAGNVANSINAMNVAIDVGVFNLIRGRWIQVDAVLPAFNAADFRINNGDGPLSTVRFTRALSGTGLVANPYQITDVYGLQGMGSGIGTTLNYYYQLANNIDATGTGAWNDGLGFLPIGRSGSNHFRGYFDGFSYVIDGLTINRPSVSYIGLFGLINGTGNVLNVALTNVNIIGGLYTGGLSGWSAGSISNSYSDGSVAGTTYTGGLVGQSDGLISTSYSMSDVSGVDNVGGLVGLNNGASATVINSYSTGNVSGNGNVGGLVGRSSGTVSNSYSIGNVSGNGNTGGLVGLTTGTITNSYWNTETSGMSTSAGGAGLTTVQMMDQANFTGWDFATVWGMAVNGSLPYLKAFYPGDVRAVSGITPVASAIVNLVVNGTIVDSTSTYANGFYYFLMGENVVSGMNNAIANNASILTYLDNAASVGNAIAVTPNGAGSVNGLDIIADTVSVGSNNTATLSIANLAAAKGALSDDNILYSVSGSDLTIGNAANTSIDFLTSSDTTFVIDGNMTNYTGGSVNYTFNGAVTVDVASSATVNAGSGDITFNQPISWSDDLILALITDTASGTITLPSAVTAANGILTLDAHIINASSTAINLDIFNLGRGQWVQVNASLPDFNVNDFRLNIGGGPHDDVLFIRALAGDGSSGTPYQIADVYGLQGINSNTTTLGYSYQLANDIDATSTSGWNDSGGTGFVPIGNSSANFTGNFDGLSHVIDGLTIDRPLTTYVGLFGMSVGSEIKNVGLTNSNINGNGSVGGLVGSLESGSITNSYSMGSVSGNNVVGGLVGAISVSSIITNSYSMGNVSGDLAVGGLVGSLESGSIANSYSTGNVSGNSFIGGLVGDLQSGSITNSYSMSNVSGDSLVGGLIGVASTASDLITIDNSYSTGSVSGSEYVGGLIGNVAIFGGSATISNSYSIGSVSGSGSTDLGGLLGAVTEFGGSLSVSNSYWNTETSGMGTSAGGTGLTTAQMMDQANFTGWDFSTVWGMAVNGSLPYLKVFYPGDVRAVSGITPVASAIVNLVVNGTIVDSTSTYANGFYYFLTGENVISGMDNSIANNASILTYLDNAASVGNAIAVTPNGAGSVNGLDIIADTVSVGSNNTSALTIANLAAAKGALSDDDILYSVSGSNLIIGNDTHGDMNFSTTNNTTYTITGDISPYSGRNVNYTFNGAVILDAPSVTIDAHDGDISFFNTVDSLSSTARALILNSTVITTLGDAIGSMFALSSLTTNADGVTVINGGVTTTGTQTYNNMVVLGDSAVLNADVLTMTDAIDLGNNNILTINNADASSISGVISGTGTSAIIKDGAGTLTLDNAANTYTGITVINDGTLSIGTMADQGSSSSIGTNTFLLNGGTLSYTGGTVSVNRNYSIGSNGGVLQATSSGDTLTLTGTQNIAGSGGGANSLTVDVNAGNINLSPDTITTAFTDLIVTGSGAGTLTLGAIGIYTGTTTVNSGTLQNGIADAIANTLLTVNSLGTYNLNGFINSIAGLSGDGTVTNTGLMAALTDTESGTNTFSGAINGAISLIKEGVGTLVLSGTNSTYSGATMINEGTLSIASVADSGTNSSIGTGSTTPAISIGATGILDYTGSGHSTNRDIELTASGGTINASGSGTLTLNGDVTGDTFDMILRGTGTGIINGNITTTTGGITKLDAGAWTLAGSNTNTGAIEIGADGGVLNVDSVGGLGVGTGTVTVNNNGTLNIGFSSDTLSRTGTITLNGSGNDGLGSLTFSGTGAILDNDIAIASNTLIGGTGSDARINGDINGVISGAQLLTIDNIGSFTFGGAVGNTVPLNSLLVEVPTTIAGTSITTTNLQQYASNITLSASPTLITHAGGHIAFLGAVSGATETLTLLDSSSNSTGIAVIFYGNVTLLGLVTFGGSSDYSVGFAGATNTFTNAVVFNNAFVSLGDIIPGEPGDIFNFNGGVSSLADLNSIYAAINTNGNDLIFGDITAIGDVTLNSDGGVLSVANISGDGGNHDLTIDSGAGALNLNGSIVGVNEFSEFNQINISNTGASNDISINNGITANNNISIVAGGNIDIGNGDINSIAGDVSLTGIAGAITQTGSGIINAALLTFDSVGGATLNNANTISSLNAVNSGSGNIQLTNIGDLDITGINQTAGNLTISNTGAITQSGSISVSGDASFDAGANAITLGDASNAFTGAVSLINTGANNVAIANNGALEFGTTSIGSGTFDVTASGNITQTGNITQEAGAGTFTITQNAAGSDVILSQANDITGSLTFAGTLGNTRDVTLRSVNAGAASPTNLVDLSNLRNLTLTFDNAAIELPELVLAAGGNMVITAGGAITQSGSLTVDGAASFNAGANAITLGDAANAFSGTVSLSNSGANDVTITNNAALELGTSSIGQNLIATANGAITQSGALSVGGTSGFNAGANAITLGNAANVFSGAVSLNNSGANDVTITNNAALEFGVSSIGQNLVATADGAITQSGALTVGGTSSFDAGANAIILGDVANAFSGTISLNNSGANDITIANNAALELSALSVGQNLVVTADGAITQSGALTVSGTSSFNAGANAITLDDAANAFSGAVSLSNSGANDVTITNSEALELGASSIGQNLVATADGAITQSGALSVGGTSSFDAGANAITLGNASNTFAGVVSLSNSGANNVTIANDAALDFGVSSIGQNLVATADGAITQSGALTIGGTSSFNAGANAITLTNAANALMGAVSLSNSGANDVTIANDAALNFGISSIGQNLIATADGAITQSGALTVGGMSSFNAGANAITLTNAANALTGAVSLTNSGANNASITNNAALNFGVSSIGQNLIATAVGAITQSGALTVGGTSSFNAGANAITLTNAANALAGAVSLTNSGANNASITNNGALDFGISSIGQNLIATAVGAITQSGALTVGGATTVNAGANAITLGNAANQLTGIVSLNNSGAHDVVLNNNTSLVLGNTSVGQNIDLTTTGSLTQVGTLTGGTLTANAVSGIMLNGNNNLAGFNAANTGTGNIVLTNTASTLVLTDIIQNNGNVAISNAGNLTVNGVISTNTGSIDLAAIGNGNLNLNNSITTASNNNINLSASGSGVINLNTNNISTAGAAINFNSMTTLVSDINLTNNTINFNSGINGGMNLGLNVNLANISGALSLDNITVNGLSANNTLNLDTGGNQNWNITSANNGNITGVAGVSGNFDFAAIHNLGGGSGDDTFTFSNNASIAGLIDGGNLDSTNTLNYLAYSTPIKVNLSDINDGVANNAASLPITNFTNINNLVVNNTHSNIIVTPNKAINVVVTDALIGIIGDPIFFNGFNTLIGQGNNNIVTFTLPYTINPDSSITVNGVNMFFINFILPGAVPVIPGQSVLLPDISNILQQPEANASANTGNMTDSTSSWKMSNYGIDETVTNIINNLVFDENQQFEKTIVDQYCHSREE